MNSTSTNGTPTTGDKRFAVIIVKNVGAFGTSRTVVRWFPAAFEDEAKAACDELANKYQHTYVLDVEYYGIDRWSVVTSDYYTATPNANIEHITSDTGESDGAWTCVCGNREHEDGFDPSTENGRLINDDDETWDGRHFVCAKCGRIIDQNTLTVVGNVKSDATPTTTTTTDDRRATQSRFAMDFLDITLPDGTYVINEFEGFTFNESWNGWGVPTFSGSVCDRLMVDLLKHGFTKAEYDREHDAFVVRGDEMPEDETYVGFDITLENGSTAHVYGIGAHSWTWDERQVHYGLGMGGVMECSYCERLVSKVNDQHHCSECQTTIDRDAKRAPSAK